MSEQADHDGNADSWSDALRGKVPSTASAQLQREAELLRALVMGRAQARYQPPDAHTTQRFLFRLRQEGLLQRRRSGLAWAVAAGVAVAGLGLGIVLNIQRSEEMPETGGMVWRGEAGSQTIQSDKPDALAQQVDAVLQRASLVVWRAASPGAIRLQAKVPPQARAVRAELAGLGVIVPEHGRLDLVIVKRSVAPLK